METKRNRMVGIGVYDGIKAYINLTEVIYC